MRRMIYILIAIFICGFAHSQPSGSTALEMLNIQGFKSAPVTEAKATIGKDDDLTIHNLNQYKYTTTPEKGKDYKEYQVIKLDGLSNLDVLTGMLTHTLDRETRYIELSENKEELAMVREILKSNNSDYVFVSEYVKEYFIGADGSYRYIDGRDLVGNKKVKTYLEKGKPVTATTFFFALKDKGVIAPEVSLRGFISMSTEERVQLLGMDIYAAPKEEGDGTVSK